MIRFRWGVRITETWVLKLYIAGETEVAKKAIRNLQKVCDEHLKDRCDIEVIDLRQHPELALEKEIVAIPTLVKELPPPVRKLIGDLHATGKVFVGLDVQRQKKAP